LTTEETDGRRVESAVYTIGHSSVTLERLGELLGEFRIQVVVDIRSSPYSRFAPQFNEPVLRSATSGWSIQFLSMGEQLGGRPAKLDLYDALGHVLYWRLAREASFISGIDRLIDGARNFRVAIMCSEEDPMDCHRRLLVGRVLGAQGVAVLHIRGSGALQSEAEVHAREVIEHPERAQMRFFDSEEASWKSIRSVSRVGPPPVSSNPSYNTESLD
jgi:uncharacterized protein (DUF488 family)